MFTISIVVPTYNRPALLAEALHACLAQTHLPSEIVVGDDSSDDRSQAVVAAIQAATTIPIRYIHNKPGLRQVANVNMLFNTATGDKVMLLHDDDLLLPDALKTLAAVFRTHETVSIAFGKQYLINQTGDIDYSSSETFNRDFFRTAAYDGVTMTPFDAGLSQQIPNNGYLIDTAIARKIQYSDEAGDACDFYFGYQVGLAGYRTYFVNDYLGMYRLHNDSISHDRRSTMAYHAYQLLSGAAPTTELGHSIRALRLHERAPIAITEAVYMGRKRQALSILLGPWYRSRVLTPRGIKRLLLTLFHVRPVKPLISRLRATRHQPADLPTTYQSVAAHQESTISPLY